MSNENVVLGATSKLLNVGRAWINDRNAEDANQPKLTIKMDRDLGINLTLAPSAQILLFANPKRDGINPNTQQPYQDADYRVAVAVPVEVADREIARQAAAAQAQTAQADISTPVASTTTPVAARTR